jgi:hypothetical protein
MWYDSFVKRAFVALLAGAALLAGCGGSATPSEGCRGHGGVAYIAHDATNGSIPFYCKDGTVGAWNP